jgi:hypothetical protein
MMSFFVVAPREIVGLDSWSIFLVAMCHQTEPILSFSFLQNLRLGLIGLDILITSYRQHLQYDLVAVPT